MFYNCDVNADPFARGDRECDFAQVWSYGKQQVARGARTKLKVDYEGSAFQHTKVDRVGGRNHGYLIRMQRIYVHRSRHSATANNRTSRRSDYFRALIVLN